MVESNSTRKIEGCKYPGIAGTPREGINAFFVVVIGADFTIANVSS
jgi:hypothetical protein